MRLAKYSFGIGDRFAHQGEAQLKAFTEAKKNGVEITPVWNKSNREHMTINSHPRDTRHAAENAVKKLNWEGSWFVDADHINMSNVDKFIESSDFFTIDVADFIGRKASAGELDDFLEYNLGFTGEFNIPGLAGSFDLTREMIGTIGEKFLFAINEAAKIYRHIESKKGKGNFITEISMDEVSQSQTPLELFFILGSLAYEKIPVQTIAPKFSGRFNKGVDYQGDLDLFTREFEQDLLVIDMAVKEFGLPEDLKLSVHSGSDKFSIYPVMGKLIRKYDKGIHIKTAGTTWLEEMTGLALAGGEALDLARNIYRKGLARFDELCGPYATVIDINRKNLPETREVSGWDGNRFANALRHDPDHPDYNPDMRQLVHVAYKIAAEYGNVYVDMLKRHKEVIAGQVTANIYDRHFGRIFELKKTL
jgi:tagaturonate epimerase